jgi:DNA repair protein RadC
MAAPQSDSISNRPDRFNSVYAFGLRFARTVARSFGWLATSDNSHSHRKHVRGRSHSESLRDWSGNLGLPSVCDDFWSNDSREKARDKKLLGQAIGKGRIGSKERSLFEQFGSLPRILLTDPGELTRITGDSALASQLAAIKELALKFISSDDVKPMLGDTHSLIRYLRADMGHLRNETFRAIFLDAYNRVILAETLWHGTVSEVYIHPREVMRRAIEIDATALIVAHNHPSGVLIPSDADIRLTGELLRASKSLGLTLHDHLIISAGGATSMRLDHYIEPWI